MARTYSIMAELGKPAADFDLPAAHSVGKEQDRYTLADFHSARVLVVVFTCNHCPYARHVEPTLIRLAREYQDKRVAFVAISPNDADAYPEDRFENMTARAREAGYPFPYLYDASQEVARAYEAVCTPDVFVYDVDRLLAYRGRVDASRPQMGESTGEDLRSAIEALLAGRSPSEEQWPSMGCNIKWKAR